ncbi:MAG: xylulokinase, partial [Candidatus Marinimicrobia bacterium]|nr:xylulokinase [Candidatus Neomarinimicrobiota bacterium]
NEPEVYQRIAHILLPKDYIRYRLTGEFATDVSDASGMLLLDVGQRRWSPEIMRELKIPAEWLPAVHESPELTGKVTASAAADAGLAAGTPVVAGGGDQAAGAVGTGTVAQGILSVVLGTSGVVFAHSDHYRVEEQGRLHAFCHAVPGSWHLMGVTLAAGGSFRWYRDVLGSAEIQDAVSKGADPYEVLIEGAKAAPEGSEGLLFLPYLSGERTPYPDPYARGGFIGLSNRHGKGHLTRAVLEGITYSLKDCVGLMEAAGVPINEVRASGGGAKSPFWRQLMADIFNLEIITLDATDGAPFGAALLAAVGSGQFASVEEACAATIHIADRMEPEAESVGIYQDYYPIYQQLYSALKEINHTISHTVEAAQKKDLR